MDQERPYIKVERKVCPHCDQQLSIKTYKTHKRFYDSSTNTWLQKETLIPRSDSTQSARSGSSSEQPPPPLPPNVLFTPSSKLLLSQEPEMEDIGGK